MNKSYFYLDMVNCPYTPRFTVLILQWAQVYLLTIYGYLFRRDDSGLVCKTFMGVTERYILTRLSLIVDFFRKKVVLICKIMTFIRNIITKHIKNNKKMNQEI